MAVAGILFASLLATATASRGDSTLLYQRCIQWYRGLNCSLDGRDTFLAHDTAPTWLKWFGWSCSDNCGYECMWITVDAFLDDGLPIPQFHGKWPFVRLLGIQEPASALASFLNFVTHLVMTWQFVKRVHRSTPLYGTWITYSLCSMAAWLFSTIFHTRDKPLTEKLDYFGALSYLLCLLYASVARIILGKWNKRPPLYFTCAIVVFFFGHISYLSFVKFDYKYNLIVNVGIGAINCFLWLYWCLPRWRSHPHNRNALFSVIALNCLVGLELFDFPPILWSFDAHALWHVGTILLAIPWYRFIIEDSLLLRSSPIPHHELRKAQ